MEEIKEVTHIVPVGFRWAKLIASVRQHIVHKVIILTVRGDEKNARVKEAVKKLGEAFKGLPMETKVVEREDVFKTTLDILDIIEVEVKTGKSVKINVAGGMRNIGISAYIAALVSKVDIYSDIPGSEEDDEDYTLKGILQIPPFPIREIPKEKFNIIKELDDGVDSLDDLISKLKPGLNKGTSEYLNERSRVSHHIKKLKEEGFVETEKKQKTVSIRRSMLGEIYIRGKEITALR